MPNRIDWTALITGLAMITMGSTLTALLKPQKSLRDTLKYWTAGIIAGCIVLLFCHLHQITSVWADVVKIVVATFVSTVYPKAEEYVKKYSLKKIKDETDI